jgi:hypothetical protein
LLPIRVATYPLCGSSNQALIRTSRRSAGSGEQLGMALQPSNLTAIDFIEAGRVEPLTVVITRRGRKEVACCPTWAMIYQHEARGADKMIAEAIDSRVLAGRVSDDDGAAGGLAPIS